MRNYPCFRGEKTGDCFEILALVLGADIIEVDESLHDPRCWIELEIEERGDGADEVVDEMAVKGEEGPA